VRLLADTQCFLWSFLDPTRVSEAAVEILTAGQDELFFSAVSSWEIAIKAGIGKLRLPVPPEEYVPPLLVRAGMTALAITHAHALRVHGLSAVHKDPFDRLPAGSGRGRRADCPDARPADRQVRRQDHLVTRRTLTVLRCAGGGII